MTKIKIYEVSHKVAINEPGVHLINPLNTDINDAITQAINKGFKTIWIHKVAAPAFPPKLLHIVKVQS